MVLLTRNIKRGRPSGHMQIMPTKMKKTKPSHNARAVVTGAGSGIGRAIAIELASRGSKVLCSDVNLAGAEETAALIAKQGGTACAMECDVTQIEAVEAMAQQAQTFFDGPVTLLVNNAGIGVGGQPVGVQSLDDWRAALDVNLHGAIHCAHQFTPTIRAHGSGGILTIASAASFSAMPLMAAYNVSKAGVLALSETLRAEMAGTHVHVTAVCPTFVKTAIVENGRISNNASGSTARLMEASGITAEALAKAALNGLDRDEPYVVPQLAARTLWRIKRALPGLYGQITRTAAKTGPLKLQDTN